MILKQYYSCEFCLKCYDNIEKIIFIFWRNADIFMAEMKCSL